MEGGGERGELNATPEVTIWVTGWERASSLWDTIHVKGHGHPSGHGQLAVGAVGVAPGDADVMVITQENS